MFHGEIWRLKRCFPVSRCLMSTSSTCHVEVEPLFNLTTEVLPAPWQHFHYSNEHAPVTCRLSSALMLLISYCIIVSTNHTDTIKYSTVTTYLANTSFHFSLFQKLSFKQMFRLISTLPPPLGCSPSPRTYNLWRSQMQWTSRCSAASTVACHRDETIFADPLNSKQL